MTGRNRSEGWKHAKLTGHENEARIDALVEKDSALQTQILNTAKKSNCKIEKIEFGGLKEKDVDCVLGGKTKSKTDMYVHLDNGSNINVSIKKSAGGQVFLIGVNRFISGFEKQFNKNIPEKVKRAMSLYWGTADDIDNKITLFSTKHKAYEVRKHRLVNETIVKFAPDLSKALIDWFNDNMIEVFDFCFSTGLAQNKSDWATAIWYRNELSENNMNNMFLIEDIKAKLTESSAEYGTRTGGSTIQLPFGFVQWHSPKKVIPGLMQFHHSFKKISELMNN